MNRRIPSFLIHELYSKGLALSSFYYRRYCGGMFRGSRGFGFLSLPEFESESERFSYLRCLLAQEPSVTLWQNIQRLLDTWDCSLLLPQALEMTRHYLEDWPPGLRQTSLCHRKRPSFALADVMNERDCLENGENIRKKYPQIVCHSFKSSHAFRLPNEREQNFETDLIACLQQIQFCRCLEVELPVDNKALECLKRFEELELLKLEDCRFVTSFRVLKKTRELKVIVLKSNDKVDHVEFLPDTPLLQVLELNGMQELRELDGLKHCSGLRSLVLQDCPKLEHLQALEYCLQLEHLELSSCGGARLNSLHLLVSLKRLRLQDLEIQNPDFLNDLQQLEELAIEDCQDIVDFLPLQSLEKLHSLRLENLVWNGSLLALSELGQLEHLELIQIEGMEDLRCLEGLHNLKSLKLVGTPSLKNIEGLKSLSSLDTLVVEKMSSVEDLKPLSERTDLKELRLCDSMFVLPESWSVERWHERERLRASGTVDPDELDEELFDELLEEHLLEQASLFGGWP